MKKLTQRRRDAESELVSTGIEQETVDFLHPALSHKTSLRFLFSFFVIFVSSWFICFSGESATAPDELPGRRRARLLRRGRVPIVRSLRSEGAELRR